MADQSEAQRIEIDGVVLELPAPAVEREHGGASGPALAYMTPEGREYCDPYPWCPLLGALGIPRARFEPGFTAKSVTTWLNYMPKDRLVEWAPIVAANCAYDEPDAINLGREIAVWWWSTAPKRVRDEAGERGGIIHDFAEDGQSIIHVAASELLAKHELPDEWLAHARVASRLKGLQKFFRDYPGIIPLWVEVTVFNRTLGYAGTIDLIAWVPTLGIVIIDWKTSNHVLPKYSVQVACYRWAEYGIVDGVRIPVPRTEAAYIVHITQDPDDPEDGRYRVVAIDTNPEMVPEVIAACKAMARWDHASRIGKEATRPIDLTPDSVAATAPRFDWTTPAEIAERFNNDSIMKEIERRETAALDPYVRLRRQKKEYRDWQMDYVRTIIPNIRAAADEGNPLAVKAAQTVPKWWAAKGLPALADEAWQDPFYGEAEMGELCAFLGRIETEASLPFATVTQPPAFDWDDLLRQFIDEQTEAEAHGHIRPDPNNSDRYVAVPPAYLPPVGVVAARRGRSVDPDAFTTPRDPQLIAREDELIATARRLPPDLLDELNGWARAMAMPSLLTRLCSAEHLDLIASKLNALCMTHAARCDEITTALRALADMTPNAGLLVLSAAGVDVNDAANASSVQADNVVALCEALVNGIIRIEPDENGETVLVTNPEIEPGIITLHGGKREARAAASEIAKRLGLQLPRSISAALTSPLLAAHLCAGAKAGPE